MSFQTIRDEIKTIMEGITGIGNVHDYVRSTYFWDEFFAAHKDVDQILTWEITRIATAEEVWSVQNAAGSEPNFHDTHNITIVGHMSLQDSTATEKTFQDLVTLIQETFRQNNDLNGTVIIPKQLQVKSVGHVTYANILVHRAVLTYEAIERVGG